MKKFLLVLLIIITSCSPPEVEYAGRAQNFEHGAVINQNSRIIYMGGMKAWPEKILGKKVKVSGKLVKDSLNGKPEMVVENPQWKLAD